MDARWECRYSSCEMMYLEIASGSHVRTYLDHSPGNAELTSFEDVLAGKMDGEVSSLFGAAALTELKAAILQMRPELANRLAAPRAGRAAKSRPGPIVAKRRPPGSRK